MHVICLIFNPTCLLLSINDWSGFVLNVITVTRLPMKIALESKCRVVYPL